MLLPFVIFAVLFVVGLLVLLFWLYPSSARVSTIPGLQPSNESDGNYAEIKKAGSFVEFLCDLHTEFGPIASFWLGKEFCVSVASADLFKETAHLFDRPGLLFKQFEPLIGEQSIQFACGPEAQALRRVHDKAFSHAAVVSDIGIIQQVGEELSERWSQMADGVQHIPLTVHMCGAIAKILTRSNFGDYFKDEKALLNFRKDYDIAFGLLDDTFTDGPIKPGSENEKKLKSSIGRLKSMVKEIIKQREEDQSAKAHKRLIDLMVESYTDEDQLYSDVMTFMIGGFHTTSYFLVWLIYFVATHADVQEKLLAEIKEHYKGGPVTAEQLKHMKYLRQVMDETYRLTKSGGFAARFSSNDMMLGGHKVPKSTPIVQALAVMDSDEDIWPDHNRFDPERFADRSKIPPYTLEPFGFAGKRRCPAYRLAELESQVLAVLLLSRYKVSLAHGQVITMNHKFVTKPSDEIWITLNKRK